MYRPTRRQSALLDQGRHLPVEVQRRLEGSWSAAFHRDVYPVLLRCEDAFADLYDADNGRPNWPVAAMLGICILQEWHDLPDQEALDHVAFDARWQVALGLTPHEAYLTRRSLVEFRRRLVRRDPEMTRVRTVFQAVGQAAIVGLKLAVNIQRLDSTRVVSNIHTRGRVALFQNTLSQLLRWIERKHPSELDRLPVSIRRWYDAQREDDSWPISGDTAKRREELDELARWLHEVIGLYATSPAICEEERYLLVVRLFAEHCELVEEEDPTPPDGACGGAGAASADRVRVRKKLQNPGTSLQSPYDPDAGYGHKGSGYHVQIAETCDNKVADLKAYQPEIITDYQVHAAAETDHDKAMTALDRLEAAAQAPEVLVVDGGYVHGASLVSAKARKVELRGPANIGPLPKGSIGREAFTFDEMGEVLACPEGHAPVTHVRRTTDDSRPQRLHAKFDAATCRNCPLHGTCVARPPNSGKGTYYLDIEPDLRARDERLALQRTADWRQSYRIRSGVEATNSELKRKHGLGQLRVRRKPRVELAIAFKLTACNAKRWTRATQDAWRRGSAAV